MEEMGDKSKVNDERVDEIMTMATNYYKDILVRIVEYNEKLEKLRNLKQEADNEW
ncbi:hypothetical protein KI387_009704, partial [Taxus chinensis]